MAYSQNMQLCGPSLNSACGSWNASERVGSAQIDASSFWLTTGANGKTPVLFELNMKRS